MKKGVVVCKGEMGIVFKETRGGGVVKLDGN